MDTQCQREGKKKRLFKHALWTETSYPKIRNKGKDYTLMSAVDKGIIWRYIRNSKKTCSLTVLLKAYQNLSCGVVSLFNFFWMYVLILYLVNYYKKRLISNVPGKLEFKSIPRALFLPLSE